MKAFRKISEVSGFLSAAFIVIVWLLMTAEVVSRNFFNRPILGVSEISVYFYVSAAYLGFSYTQKHRGHIAVDMLYDKLGEKAKRINNCVVYMISDVLFTMFGWCAWKTFIASYKIKEIFLGGRKMPVYVLKFAIALGVTLMLIQLIVDTYDAFKNIGQYLKNPRTVQPETTGGEE